MTVSQVPRRRFGFKRWIILALIVVELILARFFPPIKPAVELAAEPLTHPVTIPVLGTMAFTNTMFTMLIADVILILAALAVYRAYKGGVQIPTGVAGLFEMIVEAIYNLVESVAGSRWARTIFPLVASILIIVITVNFMKLLPGMEAVGWIHDLHGEPGYNKQDILGGAAAILSVPPGEQYGNYHVIPFLRPVATDLNFTMSIALLTLVSVQLLGLKAIGPVYLTKFFNLKPFFRLWASEKLGAFDVLMPFIDIFVGILELIAEFARILSFTFRLFGAMFAGAILLGVTGALFLVLQLPFFFIEIFFGAIQAFVFAMLALVFLTMATQAHGGHGGTGEHEAAH
jgi:F-type H+-transporting ATPase subunit a